MQPPCHLPPRRDCSVTSGGDHTVSLLYNTSLILSATGDKATHREGITPCGGLHTYIIPNSIILKDILGRAGCYYGDSAQELPLPGWEEGIMGNFGTAKPLRGDWASRGVSFQSSNLSCHLWALRVFSSPPSTPLTSALLAIASWPWQSWLRDGFLMKACPTGGHPLRFCASPEVSREFLTITVPLPVTLPQQKMSPLAGTTSAPLCHLSLGKQALRSGPQETESKARKPWMESVLGGIRRR